MRNIGDMLKEKCEGQRGILREKCEGHGGGGVIQGDVCGT